MIIVPCSNGKKLAENLAADSGSELADYETRRFPDGEIYVRIKSDVKGKEVVLVQSGYPNPNDALMELFLAADAARDLEAGKIKVVMPYVPYSRQDKRFNSGEALSLKTLTMMMSRVNVEKLVTVDAHYLNKYGDYDLYGLPAVNISAGNLLLEKLKEKENELFVISPDWGASELVKIAAEKAGCEHAKLKKTRRGDYEVDMEGNLEEVKDKNVVVLDDIISTGGTMKRAMEKAKENGAEKTFAAATHGIFSGDAMKKLDKVASEIVTTDSIQNKTSLVSLSQEVIKVL